MKSSLRWLFLSNMFPSDADPSYGAFVKRSLDDLLSESLNICQVVTIRGRHNRWGKLRAYICYFRDLLLAGVFGQVDAMYVHYASHHCLPIALLNLVFNKRLVLHIHGDDLAVREGFSRKLNRMGQGLLVHRAELVIVPSTHFADMLIEIYPKVDSEKVLVSPSSGVDTAEFDSHDAVKNSPEYWGSVLSGPMVRVGYVGRIEEDKGWELLTQAWFLLPLEARARLHLGFWGGGKEVEKLAKQIEAIGAEHAMHYGQVAPEEVPSVHRQFDIHVVPSFRESLGLSAIEGMAAGHIVICSDIRPFVDFAVNGKHVIHFRSGDAESLKNALLYALGMRPNQLAQISASARTLSLNFDRPAVAHKLASTIKNQLCAM